MVWIDFGAQTWYMVLKGRAGNAYSGAGRLDTPNTIMRWYVHSGVPGFFPLNAFGNLIWL